MWPRLSKKEASNYGDYTNHREGLWGREPMWRSLMVALWGLCSNWPPSRPSKAYGRFPRLLMEKGGEHPQRDEQTQDGLGL